MPSRFLPKPLAQDEEKLSWIVEHMTSVPCFVYSFREGHCVLSRCLKDQLHGGGNLLEEILGRMNPVDRMNVISIFNSEILTILRTRKDGSSIKISPLHFRLVDKFGQCKKYEVHLDIAGYDAEGYADKILGVCSLSDAGLHACDLQNKPSDDPQVSVLADRLNQHVISILTKIPKPQVKQEITHREQDVLDLISSGLTNKQIADQLRISVYTVESHRKHLLSKFEAHNIFEVVSILKRKGLIP